ncbi:DUF4124 domain-containing protein [Chromobacterium vaccinii]|uniref:DUF4124 domain-containing protein n=1 Tax=Chromobacterium TaxID=535 RepID=UPI00130508DD|nr:DUF4124 domain-containing protein [Chromobacterium sp. ATCC 53434]
MRYALYGLLLAAMACQAEVFKCRDRDGGIHYGQQPCPPGSRALEPASDAFSVIERDDGGREAGHYREQLEQWSDGREKRRQADARAERREQTARHRKWLAERERCRKLDARRGALAAELRRSLPLREAARGRQRLAKVEDQMQDRACHLYQED